MRIQKAGHLESGKPKKNTNTISISTVTGEEMHIFLFWLYGCVIWNIPEAIGFVFSYSLRAKIHQDSA